MMFHEESRRIITITTSMSSSINPYMAMNSQAGEEADLMCSLAILMRMMMTLLELIYSFKNS